MERMGKHEFLKFSIVAFPHHAQLLIEYATPKASHQPICP